MAANAKDGNVAELSEVQFTFKPSAVELSASEEERLRTLGLERRSGVPGLYLLRALDKAHGIVYPVEPVEEIKLEGELKVKAERLRDELAAHLKEKGTEGLPKDLCTETYGKVDLMGAWLSGADLRLAQLQKAGLYKAQLQKAILNRAQLQKADLRNAQLQERYGFDGMALHASLLRLVVDGVAFEFEAPLPASWSALGALDGS